MSIEAVATAFFGAIERGDNQALEGLCDDNMKVTYNCNPQSMDKRTNLATLRTLNRVGRIKYTIQERYVIGNRLIQRHLAQITMNDGTVAAMPTAIFLTIEAGRILTIDEYFESTQVPRGIIDAPAEASVRSLGARK
jgi:ketosteroid isomerase-like protein